MAHPILTEKTTIEDMEIGDCIPCRYKATSGAIGEFSELGTCTATEIPKEGNVATPNGKFYFIKADKGLLIADRVVQTGISWQTINNGGFVEGTILPTGYVSSTDRDIFYTASDYSENSIYTKIKKNHATFKSTNNAWGMSDCRITVGTNVFLDRFKFKKLTLHEPWDSFSIIMVKPYYEIRIVFRNDTISIDDANGIQSISLPSNYYVGKEISVFVNLNTNKVVIGIEGEVFLFNVSPHYQTWSKTLSRDVYRVISNSTSLCEVEFEYFYQANSNDIKAINPIGHKIRSLSGGCAYADPNGNPSFTQQKGFGAFPTNNEYDTYIKKSTLGEKITAGDNNIWNFNEVFSCTKGSPILGTWKNRHGTTSVAASNERMFRGRDARTDSGFDDITFSAGTNVNAGIGFRPVLEFIEPDSLQENAYY